MALLRRILLALVLGLAFLVGLAAFTGAALAQGGRLNPWLDVLTHFALIWLAGALICATVGLGLSRGAARRVLLVLGLLGIAASAALMAREFTRPIRPAVPAVSGRSLRLIQFNAWGELRDPAAAADWLAGQTPDLIAIEELTPALRLQLARRGYVGAVSSAALGVKRCTWFRYSRTAHAGGIIGRECGLSRGALNVSGTAGKRPLLTCSRRTRPRRRCRLPAGSRSTAAAAPRTWRRG